MPDMPGRMLSQWEMGELLDTWQVGTGASINRDGVLMEDKMDKIIRTDCKGEHTVIFMERDRGDTLMVHMRHKMSYADRQELIKAVPGVAYCFDRCGDYASEITIAKAYSNDEVIPEISKWIASWLHRNHPQTVMHKICAACCPFNS